MESPYLYSNMVTRPLSKIYPVVHQTLLLSHLHIHIKSHFIWTTQNLKTRLSNAFMADKVDNEAWLRHEEAVFEFLRRPFSK